MEQKYKLEAVYRTLFGFKPFWRRWTVVDENLTLNQLIDNLPTRGEYNETSFYRPQESGDSTIFTYESIPPMKSEEWRGLKQRGDEPITSYDHFRITPPVDEDIGLKSLENR